MKKHLAAPLMDKDLPWEAVVRAKVVSKTE